MKALALVKLTGLMKRSSGSPEVKIGLIDGPVATQHPGLASQQFREVPGRNSATCARDHSSACLHGTFVAGILSAKRDSTAPAICPECTLLIRPVFAETVGRHQHAPSASSADLAEALISCIDSGARVINLSVGVVPHSTAGEQVLENALNHAARSAVIVVVAAGNQGTLGSSAITRHPWVIPVAACDLQGRPLAQSNLGISIGRRGLTAPGEGVASLGPAVRSSAIAGTSVAVAFVTGAIALLWSEFPTQTAAQIKQALAFASSSRRASVVPPLLDATAAYDILCAST